MKENEKINKYINLVSVIKIEYKFKTEFLSLVIGALGSVSKFPPLRALLEFWEMPWVSKIKVWSETYLTLT